MSEFQKFLAEMAVMSREAVNDVRGTLHEAVFNQPEKAPAAGSPMNPLPREVYEQKHEVEKAPDLDMDL